MMLSAQYLIYQTFILDETLVDKVSDLQYTTRSIKWLAG